jgi:3-isopropylmalate dehydrogenase
MAKYRIGWMPGDGVGVDVMDATRIVLDTLGFDAEYIHGDIGWENWCREANALPDRTLAMLRGVDAALFGAITSDVGIYDDLDTMLHEHPAKFADTAFLGICSA